MKTLRDCVVVSGTSYRYGGWSFETWFDEQADWLVKTFDKEEVRKLYNELPSIPKVGDKCTRYLWSDCYGGEIVEVELTKKGKPKRVGVRKYLYRCREAYNGDMELLPQLVGGIHYFTLRRNGGWYEEGQPKSNDSVYLSIGYAKTYIDPSF